MRVVLRRAPFPLGLQLTIVVNIWRVLPKPTGRTRMSVYFSSGPKPG